MGLSFQIARLQSARPRDCGNPVIYSNGPQAHLGSPVSSWAPAFYPGHLPSILGAYLLSWAAPWLSLTTLQYMGPAEKFQGKISRQEINNNEQLSILKYRKGLFFLFQPVAASLKDDLVINSIAQA